MPARVRDWIINHSDSFSMQNCVSRYGDANVQLSSLISLLFKKMFHVFELH